MRSNHYVKLHLAVSLSILLLTGSTSRAAFVALDGGGTYTINDATFQNDTITVSNGSTLIIESGAVFTGSITAYDSASVTIKALSFDSSFFVLPVGGMLTVEFCSGTSTMQIFALSFSAAINLVVIPPCEGPVDTGDGGIADADGDGIADADDHCPDSDLRVTIWIGNCDSGVANEIQGKLVGADGCTLADEIGGQLQIAAANARNHGSFVKVMAQYFNALVKSQWITKDEHAALMGCVGATDEKNLLR